MSNGQQAFPPAIVQLRHMQLEPDLLKIQGSCVVTLKICNNNSSSLSDYQGGAGRKFIFLLQQTDQQTPPLSQGQQYCLSTPLTAVGVYHLQCLNYTKIKSKIELLDETADKSPIIDLTEQIRIQPPVELQNLAEVQQQKQEETKQAPQGTFQKSNSKSQYAEYERILSDQNIQYDYMPNKYLKYFKEEFKLWRDFFDRETQKPLKDKYGSQPKDKISCGSLSISQRESQKQQSVISRLRSQQEVSEFQEQELNHPKIMKKTNSQYCFNVERQVQKTILSSNSKRRPINTNTSSPHQRTEQSEADTFLDWACSWSIQQGYDELVLKKKNDSHLVNQWFTFLHNKFKISQFMYG